MSHPFVTRFAPSPTGALHLGHAYAARVAHDFAARSGGKMILRIDDIDHTRCRDEFIPPILRNLEWLGLNWHGGKPNDVTNSGITNQNVSRQSHRKAQYQAALNRAKTSYGIKTDQLSLNKIIYQNFKKISILDATNNWIIFKSEPMIKINESFFTPSFPRRKINILHYTNYKSDENFVYLENNKKKYSSIIK